MKDFFNGIMDLLKGDKIPMNTVFGVVICSRVILGFINRFTKYQLDISSSWMLVWDLATLISTAYFFIIILSGLIKIGKEKAEGALNRRKQEKKQEQIKYEKINYLLHYATEEEKQVIGKFVIKRGLAVDVRKNADLDPLDKSVQVLTSKRIIVSTGATDYLKRVTQYELDEAVYKELKSELKDLDYPYRR